jgi:hypothetical protein
MSSELERQLLISIELARCSPELREFVKDLQRQLGKARLLADLRQDLSQLPALLRPQA